MNSFLEYYRDKSVHFIGLGGVGMSGLASLLCEKGIKVSGSDVKDSSILSLLAEKGIEVQLGHSPDHVKNADAVVHSTAIKLNNTELNQAIKKNVPALTRGELLAELMKDKIGVAVAGTHGKTSTTAMLAQLLLHAEKDPTVVVGGIWEGIGSNARWGDSEYFIAEADESDGSFLRLPFTHVIATNLEAEHLDHYGDEETLFARFLEFLDHTPTYGSIVYCAEDRNLSSLIKQIHKPKISYGLNQSADYQAKIVNVHPQGIDFSLLERGHVHDGFTLPVLGEHNLLNALGSIAMARCFGLSIDQVRKGWENFTSVKRRMTFVGRYKNHLIYDDYGHHPTEVKATLQAMKRLGKKIVLIFQPHRFSRVSDQWDELITCFEGVDELFLTPIYGAGETPIDGISSERLLKEVEGLGKITRLGLSVDVRELMDKLNNDTEEKILLTMGAGDITLWGYDLIRYS